MTEVTTTPKQTAVSAAKPDFLSRPLAVVLSLDWEKAIYLAFILLAIVTRFWDLGSRVMSHDESLHTQFSYQYYIGDGYSHTPLMHGPFLFHITAVSYWLFGDSDFAARAPVALFGIVLVLVPYLLRNWIGRVGALFASFLLLISPYITYYSRYIRHDIYVISWALIVFISVWYYLHTRQDKYLWWFAAGTALMFSTKEVSFIYVAIFGSFLVLRLLGQVTASRWLADHYQRLFLPLAVVVVSLFIIGGGHIVQKRVSTETANVATTEADQGFAVDPTAQQTAVTDTPLTNSETFFRWLQIGGIGVLIAGLFLLIQRMRPFIDQFPEFDLIILFSTLVLPLVSPLFTEIAGWNPRDYAINTCMLEGQETMSALQVMLNRAFNGICWSSFLQSGITHSSIFLIFTFTIAIFVGLWWDRRRWVITAVIFHTIFLILYTSVFTNPSGWFSGTIGSLGYWLEQQAVQRGSQPWYYYFFVTPFYEFLPIIFSTLAIGYWLRLHKISRTIGYWLGLLVLALLGYSLSNWAFNRSVEAQLDPTRLPAQLITVGILVFGALLYIAVLRRRFATLEEAPLGSTLRDLWHSNELFGLIPFLTWWLLLTWAAYSYAGEKMPWLSTHFVIPMVFMVGWYFNERLAKLPEVLAAFFSRSGVLLLGLTMLLIITAALALGPLLLGQIQFGNQELANLAGIGRFLGGLLLAGGVAYFWLRESDRVAKTAVKPIFILGSFLILALLTIRFTYMANFRNADYTTEYMVYAHGAPATKSIVMTQLEELSQRLYGDKSIRVAYDSDVSWPFTWYLRDYPNRVFFGENPSQSLNDSPIVIVGRNNWDKVDPYLSKNFQHQDYTFLWWPMEDYRNFSWNAVWGTEQTGRGLGNAGVRQALWDIFFYRDYKKYGEVFGGTYTAAEWPLRHPLRLYIRNDVLAELWDHGVGAVTIAGQADPYESNELQISPSLVINPSGFESAATDGLAAPRNVAVGQNGRLYIADSGNHRIQLFANDGTPLTSWGSFGSEPGQFNEPWGIAVDDQFVYVADTWNHRIQKFTLDGDLVGVFGQSGSPAPDGDAEGLGLFFGPRAITLIDGGQLLVTDTGNHRMQLLDRNGNFLRQIGQFGNQLGQFNEPVGIATAPDGSVYLADTWNGRIQQFNRDLLPLWQWDVDAWQGQSINNKPYTAVDSAGRVYVTDPEGYRVLIFSSEGAYLGRFGNFGTDANSFALPNGIAIDAQDNVYIADAGNHRVLKFDAPFGPPPSSSNQEPASAIDEETGGETEP